MAFVGAEEGTDTNLLAFAGLVDGVDGHLNTPTETTPKQCFRGGVACPVCLRAAGCSQLVRASPRADKDWDEAAGTEALRVGSENSLRLRAALLVPHDGDAALRHVQLVLGRIPLPV